MTTRSAKVLTDAFGLAHLDLDVRRWLNMLYRGHLLAAACHMSDWDFAVDIDAVAGGGLDHNDLRLLYHFGLVTIERRTRVIGACPIGERICAILTAKGVELFCRLEEEATGGPGCPQTDPIADGSSNGVMKSLVPTWDYQRKELRLGADLVKRYRWPAANQELILAAFQEEDWPARIDDPIPAATDLDSKCRLQDTIKSLNRNQHRPLIYFRGDGTGEGILWELTVTKHTGRTSEPSG